MPAMIRRLALVLSLVSLPALAGEITCPDLATVEQVGNCGTEQELKMGYAGYCSDNQRMYDKEDQICLSLDNYKKAKDVSLWEAGPFQGYVHCSLPAETVKASKFRQVGVLRVGSMTRVVCSYDNDVDLTFRTKAPCAAEGGKVTCKE
jgi:hypothetical protein